MWVFVECSYHGAWSQSLHRVMVALWWVGSSSALDQDRPWADSCPQDLWAVPATAPSREFLTSRNSAAEEPELLCRLWKVVERKLSWAAGESIVSFTGLIKIRFLQQKCSLEAELSERISVCSATFCGPVVYLSVKLRLCLGLVVSLLENLLRPFGKQLLLLQEEKNCQDLFRW